MSYLVNFDHCRVNKHLADKKSQEPNPRHLLPIVQWIAGGLAIEIAELLKLNMISRILASCYVLVLIITGSSQLMNSVVLMKALPMSIKGTHEWAIWTNL